MPRLAGERKVTIGFVIQTYQDGKCVEQEFVAGDQVDWENEMGEPIEVPDHEYQPFDMVQPQVRSCGMDDIRAVLDDVGGTQGWGDESKSFIILEFIAKHGISLQALREFAKEVAKQENAG